MIGRAALGSCVLAAVVALSQSSAGATSEAPSRSQAATVAEAVDLAKADLEKGSEILFKGKGAKRFEEAATVLTAAIDRLSRQPELDPAGRLLLARALDYRAQSSLLRGMESPAEADFLLLVAADPSYSPDPSNTSRKILERFRKIRSAHVAYLTIQADPPEAEIIWNGRRLGKASSLAAELPVIRGPFVLEALLACFEQGRVEGTIDAGEKRVIPVRIDPVARAVRFETVPPGFDVELDGTVVGRTSAEGSVVEWKADPAPAAGQEAAGPPQPGGSEAAGSLLIDCVPAGDHTYVLRQSCYSETRGTLPIVIDFADRSPIVVPKLSPEKRLAGLSVESDVPGATVFVNETSIGNVPVRDFPLCPGAKKVQVRLGSRLVWDGVLQLEDGPARIVAGHRPLLRTLIVEGSSRSALTPESASRLRTRVQALDQFNHATEEMNRTVAERLQAQLERGTDAKRGSSTAGLEGEPGAGRGAEVFSGRLDLDADLLLTVERPDSEKGPLLRLRLVSALGGIDETVLCGEEDADCLDRFFKGLEAPWPRTAPYSGLAISRQPLGVVVLSANGPAKQAGIREGDRIVSARGEAIASPAAFTTAMTAALEGAQSMSVPLVLERGSEKVQVRLDVRRAAVVAAPDAAPIPIPRLIATADYEALLLPAGEARNAALLNLASALIGRGAHARALDLALERAAWADKVEGAAATGTARFLTGLCQEFVGERDRAFAAYKRAAEDGAATFWTPDGLPVAPLARLKLKSVAKP